MNRKALAVPIVDGLEWKTLEHTNIYGSANFRGIWELWDHVVHHVLPLAAPQLQKQQPSWLTLMRRNFSDNET